MNSQRKKIIFKDEEVERKVMTEELVLIAGDLGETASLETSNRTILHLPLQRLLPAQVW